MLALVLILIITMDGGGKAPKPDPPHPHPDPPGPVPINTGVNPYFIDEKTLKCTRATCSGLLGFNQTVLNGTSLNSYISNKLIKLNPKNIPTGLNNNYSTNVGFEFGQVDFKIHKIKFWDNDTSPFSPPSDLVLNKDPFYQMSVDMVALNYTMDPFGFMLRSTRTKNDTFVHTHNSDFVMSDKFMQLDL